jgi:hypothetical protein
LWGENGEKMKYLIKLTDDDDWKEVSKRDYDDLFDTCSYFTYGGEDMDIIFHFKNHKIRGRKEE